MALAHSKGQGHAHFDYEYLFALQNGLKLKVKDIDNMAENWNAGLFCQSIAYIRLSIDDKLLFFLK